MQRMEKRAREDWDRMSHEQRESRARATPYSSALLGKLSILQQLHNELVEDATERQQGTSHLEAKLRSSRVILSLLDDCAAKLRETRDKLRLESETADTLAELLRGTTRALLEAPPESIELVTTRLPHPLGWALNKYVNGAQKIKADTVFDEIKKVRKSSSTEDNSKDSGGKRKRVEISDDDGEGGSDRAGEGPSGGTRMHSRDLSGRVNGGGGSEEHDSLKEDGILSTIEFPGNTTDPTAPVSGIVTQKAPAPDGQINASSSSHTVSPTEHDNTHASAPALLASSTHGLPRRLPVVPRQFLKPLVDNAFE
jgi:hypothetical protein